jgi:trehalose 6-phosphate phosphatase
VFIDFDGTLAPIVDDPAEARPHSRAIDALRRLSERWGVVAVVSGRPAAYLVEHLSGAGRTQFLGLYGLEQASGDESPVRTHPDAETWRRAVSAAADEAERSGGPVPAVERKGLTVTLHYRAAPDQAAAVVGLADRLARRYGLDAHGGKMSVELRPPVEVDKGTVIADRAAGLAAVAFAGDDLGDLPAFRALAALRSTGVATLAVASGGPETPPEVLESADVVVEGPDGVVGLLEELVAQT